MRTVVALVEAHPETIVEDYRRVLDLGQLKAVVGVLAPQVLAASVTSGFVPGWGATPWQLDGTLAWLGERARQTRIMNLTEAGAGLLPEAALWQDVLLRHQTRSAAAESLRLRRFDSHPLPTALAGMLPAGVQLPVGLAEGPALLLTAPTLRPGWGVAGACEMVQSLMTRGASLGRHASAAEVAVAAVEVARAVMPNLGVVLDGTLWGIGSGGRGRRCVARNVLLAGTDPVAVDAVALRLAGRDPGRLSWLRLCHDRGLGRVQARDIRLVGRTDLLDLDFGGGDLDLDHWRGAERAGVRSVVSKPLRRWFGRVRQQAAAADLAGTAWGRLHDAYLAGGGGCQETGVTGR